MEASLNVQSLEQSSPDAGQCGWQYNVYGVGNNDTPQTPEDYVTVPLYSSVTIAYAIK